jgi:hypothetical protein
VLHGLPLEGSGDFCAAFLKNCRAHDNQHPQGAEEDEAANRSNHRAYPSLSA